MGADGGSIPDRRDLVKSKARQAVTNDEQIRRVQWSQCALSKRPLREPIVLDALGKMYNKDAILEFLLDRTAFGDGESIAGHIRSMKDLITLNLTPNPKLKSKADEETTDTQGPTPLFICPLSLREANGLVPFVAVRTTGDVYSEAGLKAIAKEAAAGGLPAPLQSDLIHINPPTEVQKDILIHLTVQREEEKARKKDKKRKSTSGADEGENGDAPKKAKKVREAAGPVKVPLVEPSRAQALAKAVSKDLKEAEDQRKKAGMSAAVQSLYRQKGHKDDENYMTRGTFTRFA